MSKPNVKREFPEEYDELADDSDYQATRRDAKREAMTKDMQEFVVEGLGQVPPSVPVRWIEVDEEERPYRNPEQEFVQSPFPLDIATLCRRWDGLWHPHEIESEFARRDWPTQRFEYHDELNQQAYKRTIEKDGEFQARILRQDITRLSAVLDMLHADLQQGVEYRPVKGAGAFGYVKMPLTVESKAKLARQIVLVTKLRGARIGLAEEISERIHSGSVSIVEEMRQARAQTDPEYAAILRAAGLGLNPALPEGDRRALDLSQRLERQPVDSQFIDTKEVDGKYEFVEDDAEDGFGDGGD